MNRENAIRRIRLLKDHFAPTPAFYREIDKCTFDFDLAYKVVRKIRPEEHYKVIDIMNSICEGTILSELKGKDFDRIETNKLTKKLLNKIYEEGVFTPEQVMNDLDLLNRCTMQIGLYNCGVTTKFAVQIGLYAKTIKNLGSKIHNEALRRAVTCEDMGWFGLTELGHGSDVSRLETTAHFDPEANQFILHSPTETSRKFWIGNLGKTASMAVIFAQLITERVNQGVHAFLVPVRDKKTHTPLPGIEIGDCGDKLCLQAIDNGWIKFNRYRVPKEALLNGFADVTSDGVYFSVISSKTKRFAFQIGSLSGGRIAIAQVSSDTALAGLTTTLRYLATRTQFKDPATKEEKYLLDYKINQFRLLTHFSKHFLFTIAVSKIVEFWNENLPKNLDPKNKNSNFIHLMSSICKSVCSWEASVAANECRQAMGGIGFSHYAGLRDIIGINDLNRTWEGDNNVLFQQAGRLILKNLANLFLGKPLMPTWEFLTPEMPEPEVFKGSINDIKDLLKLLTIRANTMIHETGARLQMSQDKAHEWDRSLGLHVFPMTHAFFHRFVLNTYIKFIEQFDEDKKTKIAFERMGVIFAQTVILDNAEFYREYLTREHIYEIKEDIMAQLEELRKDAVPLTYLLQFRDRMLGTVGAADLNSYQRFITAVQNAKGCYGQPPEWRYLYEDTSKP